MTMGVIVDMIRFPSNDPVEGQLDRGLGERTGAEGGECWIEGYAAGWGGKEGDWGGIGTSNIITLFSVWFA